MNRRTRCYSGIFRGKIGAPWVLSRGPRGHKTCFAREKGRKRGFYHEKCNEQHRNARSRSTCRESRLNGEILYHLLDILELEDDREWVIDETSLLAMEVLRKEVNLGTDYVGLYKVYRDCEATTARGTFAEYCNSVVKEVAYELLCVMAERGAKVLGDVITKEELDEMSYDDIISESEIRAEYECNFPEARVDIDAYFWKSIGR